MLSINMDDVMQVVSNIQNYLIAFGVVLVLALLVMFAVRKMPKAKKKMIRAQSGLAILLALAIVVNLICTGPMSTMLDLVSGEGCNGVQREHNKKLNNGLPILHKVPPKRDYGRYFCIMAEKGGTSHGGLTEKLSPFFHAKKQEVNAYGR